MASPLFANIEQQLSLNKETTGHITTGYEHTISGAYDASYSQINTDLNEFYIFDKNTLHPAWTDPVKNARVDIYYSDGTPKHIVALQMYDLFGSPTTKFTTSDYTNSQNASPISNIGLDVGVILIAPGMWLAGNAVFRPHIPRSLASVG